MSVRSFFLPLYTPDQVREIDRKAIVDLQMPSSLLMENAGSNAALQILDLYRDWDCAGSVLVLCGSGNNGGDGLVVARYLISSGIQTQVWCVVPEERLSSDAADKLDLVRKSGIVPLFPSSPETIPGHTDLIVDALLGTGAEGPLRSPYDRWAAICNESDVPVVAIDGPTGVNLNDGSVDGPAFSARATIALGALKHGYFKHPGREYAGTIYPADIGIPEIARAGVHTDHYLITAGGVGELLPSRVPTDHKGTFGRVAVIGASSGMTGAAVLCSMAALRTGCGLVSLGVPRSLGDVCDTTAIEVIIKTLPELKHQRALAVRALGATLEITHDATACVLGCGAGRNHETQELIGRLVERMDTPLVLDADGLYPFAADPDRLVRHAAPLCITPHPGELAHLLGVTTDEIQADRTRFALRAARHFDCVCVLKGASTVVATITGQTYVNPTGNDGMATAGSGDILAGVIGSLIAQGLSILGAATSGVYLHGLAGDFAAATVGGRGMIASDILAELPETLMCVEEGTAPNGW